MSSFKCIHNVYNQHCYLFPGHFHHPKQTVWPWNTYSQLPAPGPWQPACAFSLCDAACCRVGVSGLVQDSLLVSGWSHWACPPASSLCRVGCPSLGARAPVYSAQCTCSGYTCICSGHSVCSHWLCHFAVMAKDAVADSHIQASSELRFSILLGISLGMGSLEHVFSLFNFLKSHRAVFHSGCIISHSHQQCTRAPIFPHPKKNYNHPNRCEVMSHWGL